MPPPHHLFTFIKALLLHSKPLDVNSWKASGLRVRVCQKERETILTVDVVIYASSGSAKASMTLLQLEYEQKPCLKELNELAAAQTVGANSPVARSRGSSHAFRSPKPRGFEPLNPNPGAARALRPKT